MGQPIKLTQDAASDAADDVAPGVHGVELGPRQHTLSGLRFCLLPSLLGTPEDAASDAADDVAPGVHGVELGPRQHTLSGLRFCLLPSLLGTPASDIAVCKVEIRSQIEFYVIEDAASDAPMTSLLVFMGLNLVLVNTLSPVYDFVASFPTGNAGGNDVERSVRLHLKRFLRRLRCSCQVLCSNSP
ncbi:hypothetical protein C4D60_Mb10t02230 [Musa balbisiana]|uniref:Uncharacterized protein n=1 Tax=Musa balbisiana TaxID=52838 RepID=A0A4S8IWK4_MUSBA|nr:hypothetical protein C4D60_Mb10t02230 [Musa balbisiana]